MQPFGLLAHRVHVTWEAVYAGSYRRLVALIAALCGSVPEAEEAVQEAFVRALGVSRHRPVFDDPEAWLYRVAVNVIRNKWRRVLVTRKYQRLVAAEATTLAHLPESRLVLLAALRKLPFAQREALALHYFADLSVEDIATRLGVPLGTVKARLSRGRDALGKDLQEVTTS